MNAVVQDPHSPPDETLARVAGVLYLVIILCAGFAEGYVRTGLVVPGDATTLLLSGAAYLTVFSADQVNALVLLLLSAHTYGYLIGQMFFGIHCLVLGYLLFKSDYFPRLLGALLAIAAFGYLADGFTFFLFPDHAAGLSPFYLAPVILAELSLCLWLLVRGVRPPA